MYLLVIHWPTYATESYCKWRLPALSFLRVFLVALPYNFSTSVFDAIAPTVATGRLALVANTFQAFLGRSTHQLLLLHDGPSPNTP